MAFIQRIQPAGDSRCAGMGHPSEGCAVIDCITTEPLTHHEAGAVVWHSHMDAAIHPEHRLNPHHPAEDHRSAKPKAVKVTPWCTVCKAHPAAAISAS